MVLRAALGLIMALLVLFISGCASRCIQLSSSRVASERFGSGFGQLKVMPPSVRTAPGGNLEGQVTVVNREASNEYFQYQVHWFDEAKLEVGKTEPWTPVEVYGDLQKTLRFTSPLPNATSYQISFCRVAQ